MPLQRRLPKRGFTSPNKGLVHELRLSDLERLPVDEIDLIVLKQAGLLPNNAIGAKVIASGSLSRRVVLRGIKETRGARAAIEAAGGSVETE